MPILEQIPAGTSLSDAGLGAAIGTDSATAGRLKPVAEALINQFLNGSTPPIAVRDEAVIRCAGWLLQAPAAGEVSERTGDLATRWARGNQSALRHSGAMSLLSPWKCRRGGAV